MVQEGFLGAKPEPEVNCLPVKYSTSNIINTVKASLILQKLDNKFINEHKESFMKVSRNFSQKPDKLKHALEVKI